MVSSVLNEGARGLQNSQREMLKSAQDIARANIRSDNTTSEARPEELTTLPPVGKPAQSERSGDIAEPLIELKRQELVFNASAKVVSVADRTLGSLLNVSG